MENTSVHKSKDHHKHINIGILAHVDAGKTTLAESILYLSGNIRRAGRVDHKDAFLDTDAMEKARGITIFSKQAEVLMPDGSFTLLDTPGHVDFSAEMERTLPVLDYAILVISGADGIQSHVMTLWKLLEKYQVPVFLFINKMDQPGTDMDVRMGEIRTRLGDNCVDFSAPEEDIFEAAAMCDEEMLEVFLEQGYIGPELLCRKIRERKLFPCYFGSALKMQGVEELLSGLSVYTLEPEYPEIFGARVFKISRDPSGSRLTHLKVTGGVLKVKMPVGHKKAKGTGMEWEEKSDQIRIYSGSGYTLVSEAAAGCVCAVTGLTKTRAGMGLGEEADGQTPVLVPVLTYQLRLPEGCDVHQTFTKLKALEEEEPELHLVWNEALDEIHVQVMGEVQIEILSGMIRDRYGLDVTFDSGSIVYKETIEDTVEGIGHFEPLRHYAEVHLLMEPLPRGAGLVFESRCSEDVLDRNWQRLILTHLAEKDHKGVLTGSSITDMKITVIAGRAHAKHTEGGDFRQATYRAVRQGLMMARCRLLEPIYSFVLEVPSDKVGRALSDIQKMYGNFLPVETEGEMSVIRGTAPVSSMRGYPSEVAAYTKGAGRLFCVLEGYDVCHNEAEVLEDFGYDPEKDMDAPTGSVFCQHGAGYNVPWDQVRSHAHVDSGWRTPQEKRQSEEEKRRQERTGESVARRWSDKELEEIFVRTYGPIRQKRNRMNTYTDSIDREERRKKKAEDKRSYLLVDGYNIIFAWDELKELARDNIDSARDQLMDILCNYQGYTRDTLILVFDAYKVDGNPGQVLKYKNIYVVYTKEAETADQYIEATAHEIGRKYQVKVATSDGLEQVIIMGQGARRISASELWTDIEEMKREIREEYLNRHHGNVQELFEHLSEEDAKRLEEIRLGKRSWED